MKSLIVILTLLVSILGVISKYEAQAQKDVQDINVKSRKIEANVDLDRKKSVEKCKKCKKYCKKGKIGVACKRCRKSCNQAKRVDQSIMDSSKCKGKICPPGNPGSGGCCPHKKWFCCPDGLHCAAKKKYCPKRKRQEVDQSITDANICSGKICPPGTHGPGGCCPHKNWYCCPDGLHCALAPKYCPKNIAKEVDQSITDSNSCPGKICPQGTHGPGGCCPNKNWFCCPDGLHCALASQFCPQV